MLIVDRFKKLLIFKAWNSVLLPLLKNTLAFLVEFDLKGQYTKLSWNMTIILSFTKKKKKFIIKRNFKFV